MEIVLPPSPVESGMEPRTLWMLGKYPAQRCTPGHADDSLREHVRRKMGLSSCSVSLLRTPGGPTQQSCACSWLLLGQCFSTFKNS